MIAEIRTILDADDPQTLGALKQLHLPDDARDPERADERIRREMEAMSKLQHPSLLAVRDYNVDERWYVSEYHANGTLTDRQDSFAGNVAASLYAIRPLVEGVAEIHKLGMVHRDIKSDNIFLSAENRLVLGDFGLVFFSDDTHTRISATLENVGSRDWQPEWTQGVKIENLRPTFDVFSLGKLLWWMISGRPIQRLRQWYYDKKESVERLFPNARFIRLVNPILAKCVVEDESNCLPDATSLLKEIDKYLSVIDMNADLIGDDIARTCKVCGLGQYVLKSDVDNSHTLNENFGIVPSGYRYKIFTCNHCGHVELFYFGAKNKSPPAWLEQARGN